MIIKLYSTVTMFQLPYLLVYWPNIFCRFSPSKIWVGLLTRNIMITLYKKSNTSKNFKSCQIYLMIKQHDWKNHPALVKKFIHSYEICCRVVTFNIILFFVEFRWPVSGIRLSSDQNYTVHCQFRYSPPFLTLSITKFIHKSSQF